MASKTFAVGQIVASNFLSPINTPKHPIHKNNLCVRICFSTAYHTVQIRTPGNLLIFSRFFCILQHFNLDALIAGAASGIFGEWSGLLTVLVIVMSPDYLSGLMVAASGKSLKSEGGGLDSKVGFKGLAKKAFIVIVVLLATLLDKALGTDAMVFQTACACYYLANEGLSIIENAGLMGLPVPNFVKNTLEQMRENHDQD